MKTYSLSDIKAAWSLYSTKVVFRMMESGKWKVVEQLPTHISATKAERVKMKEAMTFPEYLETYHA